MENLRGLAALRRAGRTAISLATANPGRRSPGHVDGSELALRAVLGQQVSVAAARRLVVSNTRSYAPGAGGSASGCIYPTT